MIPTSMYFGVSPTHNSGEGVSIDNGVWDKAPESPTLEIGGSGYLWEVRMYCLVSPESTDLHTALGQRVVLLSKGFQTLYFLLVANWCTFHSCVIISQVVLKLACYQPESVLSEIPVSGIT